MPPFLLPLISKGLSLLGNAALVKGKEWIKEKTGVDVSKASLSDEDITKLKEYELTHAIQLEQIKLENNKLDLALEEMFLKDKQGARVMQGIALNQDDIFSKRFIYYYATFLSMLTFAYVFIITFMDIPDNNVRFADTTLGFLLGSILSPIVGFMYGSSKSSQAKDELLTAVVDKEKKS